ncbi:maternal effect protein oskar isoform X1 [Nasonia vitripennis]|uniref:HTH OST-type domain-containing protein n=1 Tax=Nasonia vitripennis TaxID=7425 RepID=A0A7M7T840_NASVI|nr:maternal effect protein oskar isoform X1 [Nasonia vitripennis]
MKFDYSPKRPVATEQEVNEVRLLVKSCILTRKGGMPISDLRDEYKNLTDEEIPFYRLGYNSLFHFLRDFQDVRSDRNEEGAHVLVVKENQQNKHLMELIKKQKDPKTNSRPSFRKRPRRNDSYRRSERQKILDDRRRKPVEEEKEETNNWRLVEPPVDENLERPTIYTYYYFEDDLAICTEPIIGKTQLIGDDYFLQLCIKYMQYDLLRKTLKSPISCGTVQSGLTIRKACKRLDKIESMSSKLVINLGTVDIYNRNTDEEMANDMMGLLKKLNTKYGYSSQQITLCTLPPMGNISMFGERDKYLNMHSYNNWIRRFAAKNNYQLLDLYDCFTDDNGCIDYQYFQQDARMVSGTSHPHVLFNYFGRQQIMRLILNLK